MPAYFKPVRNEVSPETIRAGDSVRIEGMGYEGAVYLISRAGLDKIASHFSAGRCGYVRLYSINARSGRERIVWEGFVGAGRDMRTRLFAV